MKKRSPVVYEELGLIGVLMELDRRRVGDITTDGVHIYFECDRNLPVGLLEAIARHKQALLNQLPRLPICRCEHCGGRPVMGHLVT